MGKNKWGKGDHFPEIACYSIRYSFTRKSFAPSIVSEWVTNICWSQIDLARILNLIKDEIGNDFNKNYLTDCNRQIWEKLIEELENRIIEKPIKHEGEK